MRSTKVLIVIALLPYCALSFLLQCRSVLSRSVYRLELGGSPHPDNDDSSFLSELRKAKADKIGGYLPPEQLDNVKKDSENEFLSAMQETKKEFESIKSEQGSEAAIDVFLGRIQRADQEKKLDEEFQ
jgi:hypothetical protein|mmetsp:Transcript_27239/g.49492  ORF Transcript_27239/g.49492 Transcript_27239/m.49492 type:complete len:128 (-) Transcript_27239:225-608(-)